MSGYESETETLRRGAKALCSKFLGGLWKHVPDSEFNLEPVLGGRSNRLYRCYIRSNYAVDNSKAPQEVLIRYYGTEAVAEDHPSKSLTETAQTAVFYHLAKEGLGPNLLGVFPGGRLEEFIPSRRLTLEELCDPNVNTLIARKVAKLHSLEMPISKEPPNVAQETFNNYNGFLDIKEENIKKILPEDQVEAYEVIAFDLKTELEWLLSLFDKINSKIVFAHNDLNVGNLLVQTEGENIVDIMIIDYEFCFYSSRGADIGNHFLQRCFDYSNPKEPLSGMSYPSEGQRRHFIREYLKEYKALCPSDQVDPNRDTEDHLLMEVDYFALLMNLIINVWILRYNRPDDQVFSAWKYARFNQLMFVNQKQKFITKHCL